MGCCTSAPTEVEPRPMAGGQTVGTIGGSTVSRDEARERAAAAAEARAKAQNTRGQVGEKSKMKQQPLTNSSSTKPNCADPLVWD